MKRAAYLMMEILAGLFICLFFGAIVGIAIAGILTALEAIFGW